VQQQPGVSGLEGVERKRRLLLPVGCNKEVDDPRVPGRHVQTITGVPLQWQRCRVTPSCCAARVAAGHTSRLPGAWRQHSSSPQCAPEPT
jgi:hypothetical protein